jgi:hypothetical protein
MLCYKMNLSSYFIKPVLKVKNYRTERVHSPVDLINLRPGASAIQPSIGSDVGVSFTRRAPKRKAHEGRGNRWQVGRYSPLHHGKFSIQCTHQGGRRRMDDAAIDGRQKHAGPHRCHGARFASIIDFQRQEPIFTAVLPASGSRRRLVRSAGNPSDPASRPPAAFRRLSVA